MKLKYKDYNVQIKKIEEDNAVIEAVFSTNDIDRHGEVVVQNGWILDEFKQNPVILWGHDHSIPAIGKALDIGLDESGNLSGRIQFAVKENPLAKTIYDLFKGKYMRAFSVGYMNEKAETVDRENEEGDKEYVEIHTQNKLYEISAVNVGANALALAKSKGINTGPLEKTIKSPTCRQEGETVEECLKRKIPEISKENSDMKQEQKDIIEKEGRVLSSKNKKIIQQAVEVLNKLLDEDKSESKEDNGSKLLDNKDRKSIRVLNKTIRILVDKKKEIKKGYIKILRN